MEKEVQFTTINDPAPRPQSPLRAEPASACPGAGAADAEGERHLERYSFQVGGKRFSLQFLPMVFMDDYDEAPLDALMAARVYEVSFRLEEFTLPNGNIVQGYGTLGTGDAFRVLGGVANGILDWARRARPDYLCWHAQEPNRIRLYNRMIRYFQSRSGLRRLDKDPFTGAPLCPEAFWVGRCSA
jgi:hypothetical protein